MNRLVRELDAWLTPILKNLDRNTPNISTFFFYRYQLENLISAHEKQKYFIILGYIPSRNVNGFEYFWNARSYPEAFLTESW